MDEDEIEKLATEMVAQLTHDKAWIAAAVASTQLRLHCPPNLVAGPWPWPWPGPWPCYHGAPCYDAPYPWWRLFDDDMFKQLGEEDVRKIVGTIRISSEATIRRLEKVATADIEKVTAAANKKVVGTTGR